MQNTNLKLIKVAFTKKFKMSLYYTLNFENETYYAEAYREEGNWIRIKILAKKITFRSSNRFIYKVLFGGLCGKPEKYWIHKKSLKTENAAFQGIRDPWCKIVSLPDDLQDKIDYTLRFPWEKE